MAGAAAAGDARPAKRGSFAEESRPQANPFREFQVVVLAGGSSPRLSALTESCVSSSPDDLEAPPRCCKALLPVANRPMIWYCLRSLQESRFGDVIVVTQERDQEDVVSYLREEFAEAFQRLEVVGLGREKKQRGRQRLQLRQQLQQKQQQKQQQKRSDGGQYYGEVDDVLISGPAPAGGGAGGGDPEEEDAEQRQQPDADSSDACWGGAPGGGGGDEEEEDDDEEEEDADDDDEEEGACGTAEALLHISHLLYTDFFVLPCDIIGHVDFYALANVHRVENAACSVYLLPFNRLEQQQPLAGAGRKHKSGSSTAQQQQTSSNAVAVAYADRQLLAWQDRRSIQHGAKLKIPKLSLFYHPCLYVRSNFYDPHVYLFKHSVLQLLNSKYLRDVITSVRFDLVPYMTLMQESPIAAIWSTSRLGSHVYGMLLDSFEKEGQHHPTDINAAAEQSSSPSHLASSSAAAATAPLDTSKSTDEYTVAYRPPRPHDGHRVMFTLHPETAGLACRVNTLEDYYAANMKFCGVRTDEMRGVLPEYIHPAQPSKRPPGTRDSVVGEGVVFADSAVVKRSVVGADVRVAAGARVTTSILMEAASVGEAAVLQHCVLGKKAVVGSHCKLTNCQVRHGYTVPPNTVAEDETLPSYLNTSGTTSLL